MSRKLFLATLLVAAPLVARPAAAQVDLSVGSGGEGWRGSASLVRMSPVLGGRVAVGGLLRLTAYGGGSREYTERGDDAGGLPETLTIPTGLLGLNVGVIAEVRLARRVRIGMNLDLIGVGSGPAREIDSLRARPPALSLFRYGNADRGALNSEFYGAVELSPRVEIRAGVSHYATGYRVEEGTAVGAYQRFDDAVFVAFRTRR